eukprot:SAG25_NODE_5351_length_668_cov_1.256591_1_plen_52_part_10
MCGSGYAQHVHDMLSRQTAGKLAGYVSACGQVSSRRARNALGTATQSTSDIG